MHRLLKHSIAVLFFLIGIFITFYKPILSGLSQMQTDPGDTRLNHYFLEHEYRWVSSLWSPTQQSGFQTPSFWNPSFFYPKENVLAYSDLLLSIAPIYWIFRLLDFHPDTSYQLWTITLFALNFWIAYWVFQRIQYSKLTSAAVAYFFAFCSMRVNKIVHIQMIPQFFTLISFLAILRIFTLQEKSTDFTPTSIRNWIFVFFTSAVAQIYAGFYLGWFLILSCFLLTIIALIKKKTRTHFYTFISQHYLSLLVATLAAAFSLFPMATHYWQASQELSPRPFSVISTMLLRIYSWLDMGQSNLLYGGLHQLSAFRRLPNPEEVRAGMGVLTLILIGLGFWKTRKKMTTQFATGLWLSIGVLSLYTGRRFFGVEPWELIYSIFPGAKAIRAVGRISVLAVIPACIGLAAFFESIRNRRFLSLLFLSIVVIEQITFIPSYDKHVIRNDVQNVVNHIPPHCKNFFYSGSSRSDIPNYQLHLDAMWASLQTGIPTLNGFSGNSPQGWNLQEIGPEGDRAKIQAGLQKWQENYPTTRIFEWDPSCWIP